MHRQLQLSESKKKSCREQRQKKRERNLIIKERERTTEQLAGPDASPHSRRSEAADALPPPPAILCNALWIEPPLHAPTKNDEPVVSKLTSGSEASRSTFANCSAQTGRRRDRG
jgi:cell division protein FtsN